MKKITIVFVSIIVFATVIVFIWLFLSKNKIETEISGVNPILTKINKINGVGREDGVMEEGGYLIKINEKTIDFSNFENSEKENKEEQKKGIKSLNIRLTAPTTPVYKTIDGKKEKVKLSDLKSGQLVFVEYNKETKNLISITIVNN